MNPDAYVLRGTGSTVQAFPSVLHPRVNGDAAPEGGIWLSPFSTPRRRTDTPVQPERRTRRRKPRRIDDDETALAVLGAI